MRRVPFHFLAMSPGCPGLSFSLPRLYPGGLCGERVLTAPVRRFCLYGSSLAAVYCFLRYRPALFAAGV